MPVRVLIVEDNEATREALALLLKQEGYRVAMAANGRDAVRNHCAACGGLVFGGIVG